MFDYVLNTPSGGGAPGLDTTLFLAPTVPLAPVSPAPTILPSGAVPSPVAPTTTAGTSSNTTTTIGSVLTSIGNILQGTGGASSQGGIVGSGSPTAGNAPNTVQALASSSVVWIAGLAIIGAVLYSSMHKHRR